MTTKLLFFLTLLSLVGCSKDNATNNDPVAQLPAETQVGANTFGCYIKGKLLLPRDGTSLQGGTNSGCVFWGGYPNVNDYNEIEVRDYKSERSTRFLMHIQSLFQIGMGTYIIDESNGLSDIDGLNHHYIHCKIFNESTNSYQYYRSYANSGVLKITRYDYANQIVSGTFSCNVRNSINSTDEIAITQGRFDFNLNTLYYKVFP